MADQLTETEAHLAKLKMAKQMVVEDMEKAQSQISGLEEADDTVDDYVPLEQRQGTERKFRDELRSVES